MTQAESANHQPEFIDIDDLANPRLSELQKQAMAAAEAQPVPLDAEAVLGMARAATGLSNFGDNAFRDRLNRWLAVAREDAELSAAGRAGIFMLAVRHATNRLRIEDLVERHPEILDIVIDRPLVIAGLPRSGTTYLQNFLGADPRLRSLPYWEAVRPVPAPDEIVQPGGEDPRRAKAAVEWAQQDALLPYIKNIHEFSPDHISEDIELQCADFGSYYIEWITYAPQWRDYYLSTDQTPVYRYLKKCVQVLSWLTGPKRWLLKCPQHMEQLVPLTTVFPDAIVIINHRDPVASIQSAITGVCYGSRVSRTKIRPDVVADYWIDRYERLLRACVRDRSRLDDARTVDVYFHQLMKDPLAVVREIYAKAGLPLTEEVLQPMHAFLRENLRGKHGQIIYNLKRDFNLTAADVRKRFQFYFDHFPVQPEVK